ncbi:MAG: pilus assembly protein PilM [PVC group bacterium]|nr:pilus assembly protein PilM [PVC group bacterium]
MSIKNNADIVGIDLDGDELVFAYLKKTGTKKELINLTTYNIKEASDDDIVKMIKNLFKELKIKNPYLINVVPLHLAITKNLEIPSLDPREIREIIDLQSGRQTPYAREEIIIDYVDLGNYRQSYTKILLVIVTRVAIKRQFEIMEKVGVKIEKTLFAPEGISRFCLANLRNELQAVPVGIIHIDANFTDFIVSLRGNPIFTRSIPIGIDQISTDTDKFVEELKNSMESYYSEDIDKSPHVLVLTGAIDQPKDIEMALTASLHIPVQTMPYFKHLPLGPNIAAVPSIARHLSFFNVASVLLNPMAMKVSLIPEEIKLKRSFEEHAQALMKTGMYIICLLILIGGLFLGKIYFKSTYLQQLKSEYESTNHEAQILEKSMEKMRIIKHYIKARGYPLQVLASIYDVLPKRILLDSIKMSQEGNLYLKGTGRAMSDVFAFVVSLEDSDFFSNVQTNYTTSRQEDGEDWADFGISCILENKEEMAEPSEEKKKN